MSKIVSVLSGSRMSKSEEKFEVMKILEFKSENESIAETSINNFINQISSALDFIKEFKFR